MVLLASLEEHFEAPLFLRVYYEKHILEPIFIKYILSIY